MNRVKLGVLTLLMALAWAVAIFSVIVVVWALYTVPWALGAFLLASAVGATAGVCLRGVRRREQQAQWTEDQL